MADYYIILYYIILYYIILYYIILYYIILYYIILYYIILYYIILYYIILYYIILYSIILYYISDGSCIGLQRTSGCLLRLRDCAILPLYLNRLQHSCVRDFGCMEVGRWCGFQCKLERGQTTLAQVLLVSSHNGLRLKQLIALTRLIITTNVTRNSSNEAMKRTC